MTSAGTLGKLGGCVARVRRGVPGSFASARRARRWWRREVTLRPRTYPRDRTRRDLTEFLCQGCLRWVSVDEGGSEPGPAAFCCAACANTIYAVECEAAAALRAAPFAPRSVR